MKFCSSIGVGLLAFTSKTLGSHSFSLHHPVSVSSSSVALPCQSLASPRRVAFTSSHHRIEQVSTTNKSTSLPMGALLGALRGGGGGGAITATSLITIATSALQTGPWGVPALTAIATAVVVPLTLIRQGYSFSVGYGYSVFAMGVALWSTFGTDFLSAVRVAGGGSSSSTALGPFLLLASILFYGFRMGSFLLFREFTVTSKHEQIKSFDKSPLLKRIPLAMSVSIFYAFEVTPVLYACRAAAATAAAAATTVSATGTGTGAIITFAGAGIAWTGALMEAAADTHKYFVKRGNEEDTQFQGPTSWLYSLSRHPNYLGELLFWFGILVGGAPSFGTSPIGT